MSDIVIVDGDVLQTDEIGTFPPLLNNSITCPLLSLRPADPREGDEEAA